MTGENDGTRRIVPVAFGGALLICGLTYWNVLRHQPPPRWDEAEHIVFGWQIWADVADGGMARLLKDSYAQFYWPFLESWWVAAFMSAFGVTERAARLSSLVAMALAVPVAYYAGKELLKEHAPWTGVLAIAFLLMPASLPALAAQCMIELPATLMSLLTILMYLRAERNASIGGYAWFGCALGATFLTKYNYGLALIGAFTVVAATELTVSSRTHRCVKVIAALLPVAVVLMLWLVVPHFRVKAMLDVLANRAQGPQDLGWASAAFYPKVILADYGWSTVLLVGGLLYAARHLKVPGIRLLFCASVLYGAIIVFHHTKDTRHVYPLYPPLALLAAFALASATAAWFGNARRWRAALLGTIVLAMLVRPLAGLAQPRMPMQHDRVPVAIASQIALDVHDSSRVFVVGEFNELPADLIAWELRKRGNRARVYASMDFKQALEGTSSFVAGGSSWTNLPNLENVLREISADTVVTVSLDEMSPFWSEDYTAFNAWKKKYADRLGSLPEYERLSTVDYPDAGLSATVYRLRP